MKTPDDIMLIEVCPKPSARVNEKLQSFSGFIIKILILPVFVMSFSFSDSFSQINPGITLGYNHSIFGGPDAEAWGFLDADPMYVSRLLLGMFVVKSIFANLYFEPGLSFSSRGTRYENEWEWYNPVTTQFTLEKIILQKKLIYLSLPLTLRYYMLNNLSLAFGPEISLLLLANAIRTHGDADAVKDNVIEEYHRLDLALRMAVCYHITSNLFFQLGYLYGLSDIVKYDQYNNYLVKNMMFQLSIAYVFKNSLFREN